MSIADAQVQGNNADLSVLRALTRLRPIRPDVILLVRGGGARTDLATFDSEKLARAIGGMASYGTVMIGKLAAGVTRADWQAGLEEWKKARNAKGFQGEYLLVGDDGRTIASCVVFSSREEYMISVVSA